MNWSLQPDIHYFTEYNILSDLFFLINSLRENNKIFFDVHYKRLADHGVYNSFFSP